MAQTRVLNNPLFLGLDFVEGALRRGRSQDGYPPYNIELLADGEGGARARITLAVAGFKPEELEVTLQDNELVIRGAQTDERERDYLHHGIAARQFKRSFTLAPGSEVRKAELGNGLLVIELSRPNRARKARKVPIQTRD